MYANMTLEQLDRHMDYLLSREAKYKALGDNLRTEIARQRFMEASKERGRRFTWG